MGQKGLRLLHTADWHLGKTLKGKDRTPEIAKAVGEVARIAREERVDLVLVTGDLLDHPQPSAEAEGILVEFFQSLREAGIRALVVAGNHDPGERFERVYRPLLAPQVQVRGRVALADEGGLVEEGGLRFALLPFVHQRLLVKPLDLPKEERHLAYAHRMARLLAHFEADVVLGHFMVAGSKGGGGEFTFYLSEHYAVPAQVLPPARYIALGHLHRMQSPAENAWYPGSLVALDFGEGEGAERGVLLVEIPPQRHLPVRVEPIRQNWGRPLRTFRIGAEEALARAPEVEGFPGWARVVLQGEVEPRIRDLFTDMDHVLEVAVEGREADQTAALEEVPRGGLLAAYAMYLEEQGRKQEALLDAFGLLYGEVRGAAPAD